MNSIFLPFETRIINCTFDMNDIQKKLDPLLNNGLLFNSKKKLKAKKLNTNKLMIKTNLSLVINTQFFYIEKISSDSIKIFSRNNIIMSGMYFLLFLFGITGIIYSIITKESIQTVVIFCVWTLFVYLIGNGAQKIIRYSQIEEIESYLLAK